MPMKSCLMSGAAVLFTLSGAASAQAQIKQVGTMEIPGAVLDNYDIGFVDHATNRY